MPLLPFQGATPTVDAAAYVAENATLVGDVTVHAERQRHVRGGGQGDADHLELGARSNLQDNAVVHADAGPRRRSSATTSASVTPP